MRRNKREEGIAVIAALGVATVVLLLGFASIFMAWMNTDIARNIKLHTQARFASEGGIELAVASLEKGLNIPSSTSLGAFNVQLSSQVKGDLTEITSKAMGPHHSAYTSKAVLGQGSLKLPIILAELMKLDDSAVFKGGIWSEEGWDFNTDQVYFKTPEGDPIPHDHSPVFASKNADDYTCPSGSHSSDYCSGDEPLSSRKTDPINIPTPPYAEIDAWVNEQIEAPNSPTAPTAPTQPEELDNCPNGEVMAGTLTINPSNASTIGDTLCYEKIQIDLNEGDITLSHKILYASDSIKSIGNHSLTLADSTLETHNANTDDDSDGIELEMEALTIEGTVNLIAKNGGTITLTTDDDSATNEEPNLTLGADSKLLANAEKDIKLQLHNSKGELILNANSAAHLTSADGQIQIVSAIKKLTLHQGAGLFVAAKSNIQIDIDDGDNGRPSYFQLDQGGKVHLTSAEGQIQITKPRNLILSEDSEFFAKADKNQILIQLDNQDSNLTLANGSKLHLTSSENKVEIVDFTNLSLAQNSELRAKAMNDVLIQADDDNSSIILADDSKLHLTSSENKVEIVDFTNLSLAQNSELHARAMSDIQIQADDDDSSLTLANGSSVQLTSLDGKIEVKSLEDRLELGQGSEFIAKAKKDIQIQLDDNANFNSHGILVLDGEKIQIQSGQASFSGDTSLIAGPDPDDDGDIQIQVKNEPGLEMPCQGGKLKALLVARGKIEHKDKGLGEACAFEWSQEDIITDRNGGDFKGLIMSQSLVQLKEAGGNTFSGIAKNDLNNSLLNHLINNDNLNLDALIPAARYTYSIISRK